MRGPDWIASKRKHKKDPATSSHPVIALARWR